MEDDDRQSERTTLIADASRSVIARNDSPDVPFSQSINPYRGCEHGCIYCYARPSHAYLGYSPGLDFETRIVFKPEAAQRLREELARPGYRCEPIAMGTNTDPYQPAERRLGVTRSVLELLCGCRHPATVVTKSALILRDIDLLADMAKDGLFSAMVSVTTLDGGLARAMEPRAAAPARRLAAIEGLAGAGIPVGVLFSPLIPGLNDHEMEQVLTAAHSAGARYAGSILLRLPGEVEQLFIDWLNAHRPSRARRVLGLLGSARLGRLSESAFDARMRGTGPLADLFADRFRLACSRLGLDAGSPALDCSLFRRPDPPGPGNRQMALFDPVADSAGHEEKLAGSPKVC